MSLRSILSPFISRLFLSPRLLAFKRFRARLKEKGNIVKFFFQLDDPYSHLVAQKLSAFQAQYDIELEIYLVAPPADDVAPERDALVDFSRKDAQDIAPFYDLAFTDKGRQPAQKIYQKAQSALVAALETAEDLPTSIAKISTAYWMEDATHLDAYPQAKPDEVEAALHTGTAMRDQLGHYLGGMLYFEDVFYWGLSRFAYLENRLQALGLAAKDTLLCPFPTRPAFMSKPVRRHLTLEFYPSLRSPYSYIAMPEILKLSDQYPLTINWRPVLPMVMRGLPVPPRKGRYILMDTKREADRIGVDFGKISDPVGEPVRRGFSLYPYAKEQGRGGEFLYHFCKLCWSEGENMGEIKGLRKAIERTGLGWSEAAPYLDTPDWQEEVEANRGQLMAAGIWGVPGFRLLDEEGKEIFASWGRDRIWLLCHKIQQALVE